MTFIEPGTPVPPPFNVIPSPRNIWRAILWLCRRSDLKHFLPHEGKEVRYAAVQVKGLIIVGSISPLALHVCPSTESQANLALFAVQIKGLIIVGSINSLALNVCPSIQENLALFAVQVKGLIIVGSARPLALHVCPSREPQANLALFAV